MRSRRSGIIINVSSTAGIEAKPSRTMYSGSKFALEAFSEALYHEMKPFNVRVLLVEPGAFRSKFSEKITIGSGEWPKDYEGTITEHMLGTVRGYQGSGAPVSVPPSLLPVTV
jgi:short-subunit dehydrogenase